MAVARAGYTPKLLRGREALGDPGNGFGVQGGVVGAVDFARFEAWLRSPFGQQDLMFVHTRVLQADEDARLAAAKAAKAQAAAA